MHHRIRIFASCLFVALTFVTLDTWAESNDPICEAPLTKATAPSRFTQTIRLFWWPHSEYTMVTHTALEVEGEIWDGVASLRNEGGVEKYVRAAQRKRGIVAITLNVTDRELETLKTLLNGPREKWNHGSCSGTIYFKLARAGIMKGTSLPAQVPTPWIATLVFRKLLRDERIGKIEWIGPKRWPKFFPYPKFIVVAPMVEAWGLYGILNPIERFSPSIAHELIASGHDLYQLLLPLFQ